MNPHLRFGCAVLSLVTMACCAPQSVPSKHPAQQQILFGQGGGVTGIRIEYALHDDGSMFRQHAFSDSLTLIGRLDPDFVAQTFGNFGVLGLDTVSCNHPGDLYYFVEMHRYGDAHTIVWGYPGFKPKPEVVQYFNNLYRTAKRLQQ